MVEYVYLSGQAPDISWVPPRSIVMLNNPNLAPALFQHGADEVYWYINVCHIYGSGPMYEDYRAYKWLVLDDDGKEIRLINHPNEVAIDLRIPACRAHVVSRAGSMVGGCTGIFGDYLGKHFAYNKFHYATWPSGFTDDQMIEAQHRLIAELRAAGIGSLMGNGIPQANGPYGFYNGNEEHARALSAELDWVRIEGDLGWTEAEARTRSPSATELNMRLVVELPNVVCRGKPMGASPAVDLSPGVSNRGGGALYVYCWYACAGVLDKPVGYRDDDVWWALRGFDAGSPTGPLTRNGDWWFREYQHMSVGVCPSQLWGYLQVKKGPEMPPIEPPPPPPGPEPGPGLPGFELKVPDDYKILGKLLVFVAFLEAIKDESP